MASSVDGGGSLCAFDEDRHGQLPCKRCLIISTWCWRRCVGVVDVGGGGRLCC